MNTDSKEVMIYFDYNATTPIDRRVLDEIMPFLTNKFANANSTHNFGMDINNSIQEARLNVSELIGGDNNDIIFTSGATESINLALKGYVLANRNKGNHIITLETEHKAVLDTCKYLETIGFYIDYLPVEKDGLIDLHLLKSKLRNDTILISVMLVNNEIGVIQPLKRIAEISHEAGIPLFSDATQAVGKIEVKVNDLGIDLMAFSGHKFYAPKGIGGLYVRGLKKNAIKLEAILHGGGHEQGFRSGTLNVSGIVALGKACAIAKDEMKKDAGRITELRDKLEKEMLKLPNTFINGSVKNRIYNVSNICFPGNDANVLIGRMKNISVSNGSACSSAIIEPSHVLKALGLSDDDASASIRFSLGKYNNESEVQNCIKIFQKMIIPTNLNYA